MSRQIKNMLFGALVAIVLLCGIVAGIMLLPHALPVTDAVLGVIFGSAWFVLLLGVGYIVAKFVDKMKGRE